VNPTTSYRLAGLGLVAVLAVVVAAMFGAVDLEEQSMLDALDPPVYAVEVPVAAGVEVEPTVAPTVSPTTSSTAPLVVVPSAPAARVGNAVQVTPTDPPPPRPILQPIDGACVSWAPMLAKYGIPWDEAQPVMWRESRCSNAYNGNAGTKDDSYGPLQVNRYGRLAAWWDEGGYTQAVMSTPEGAVAAAAVLYHSCGWSPWRKPYGCDGTYLQTPEPRWGEWPTPPSTEGTSS
jgi:hypothetical protein